MTTWLNDPSQLALANGTAATSGNTGGDAGVTLDPVTSTGGTITFQDGTWQHVGNAGVARLDLSVGSVAIFATEWLVDLAATPTGDANRLIEVRNASGVVARIGQLTTGQIQYYNSAGTAIWNTTAAFTGPTRIFLAVQPATATTGKLRLHVYDGTSTTASESYVPDDANLGTAAVTACRYGRVSSTAASTATVRTVNIQAKDTDLAIIGPLVAAPTNLPTFRYSADGSTLAASGVTLMYSPDGTTLEPLDVA